MDFDLWADTQLLPGSSVPSAMASYSAATALNYEAIDMDVGVIGRCFFAIMEISGATAFRLFIQQSEDGVAWEDVPAENIDSPGADGVTDGLVAGPITASTSLVFNVTTSKRAYRLRHTATALSTCTGLFGVLAVLRQTPAPAQS